MPYDPTLPTDKDKLRLLIGDTNNADLLLQDTELTYLLTLGGNIYQAAAEACRAIAGKLARDYASMKSEKLAVTDRTPERYLEMAGKFDKQAEASVFAAPLAASTGTTPDPFFTRDMFPTSCTEPDADED